MAHRSAPLPPVSTFRTIVKVLLGLVLVFAGVGHLTFAREAFRAQVPSFVPLDEDTTVLASGVVEIALGGALVLLPKRRIGLGWILALFFVAVFPGNISQWADRRDAFGLDSDGARLARLAGQPLLVLVTLWSTGAWRDRRRLTAARR